MSRFFVPMRGLEDWRMLLADPEKQWRTGFSAKALAHCWEAAGGFPPEIRSLFSRSECHKFVDIEFLLAIPEHQVALPGGARPSQNDLFVLAKAQGQLIAIMVEGKVSETFGRTLEEWNASEFPGKQRRLAFLTEQLGLTGEPPSHVRYQLLHRSASAVIEACRFGARSAIMIVHSFSQNDEWFPDYQAFLSLFSVDTTPDRLVFVRRTQGVDLYCGWARGDPKYLLV